MSEFNNKEIAKILSELADLLEIKGENKFKVRAYKNISRKISAFSENIEKMVKENRLKEIKGVGEGIATEIKDIYELGFSPSLEELKSELPAGVLEMTKLPGLGPKRAHKLFYELEIQDIEDLKKALLNEKVRKIKGFGVKTEKKLLQSVREYKDYQGMLLLNEAENIAKKVINEIEKDDNTKIIDTLKLAGSVRRKKELIGDIDILVITDNANEAVRLITNTSFVNEIIDKGSKKLSIYTDNKVRIDFRLIKSTNRDTALQHFTGSKEHNVKLRKIAKEKGYKLNEYGLYKMKNNEKEKIKVDSEKKLYDKLGLDYIIPELREDEGEIEAASNSNLPALIKTEDIKGDLHIHSRFSDGAFSMDDMVKEALKRRYQYIAITDHSQSLRVAHGMSTEKVYHQRKKIDELRNKYTQIKILNGIEVDILNDGTLDYSDEILAGFDIVIASIHTGFKQSESQITNRIIKAMENSYVDIIAHPQGRILARRKSYNVNMEKVISFADKTNTALEINASPNRLDLDAKMARKAAKNNVKLVVNTDAHHIKQLSDMRLGVNVARRAWLEKEDLLNVMEYNDLKDFLNKGN